MTDPRPVPDAAAICAALETVDGIRQVHDAHAWVAADGGRGFAARVQIERPNAWDAVVASARTLLGERFDIAHSVLQPEANAVADLARQVQQARTDRDAAVRQGLEAEQQRDLNGELALQYERALEAERVRLGRVLNDELAQHATAIRAMAATFESRLAGREPTLAQLASLMVGNADAMLAAIRTVIQGIRTEAFDQGGLVEGVRALVDDWRLRLPAIRFELLIDPAHAEAFGVGPVDVETAAFRIVAEALDNAVLHAQARTVVVSMHRDVTRLTLQISDDGCGLPMRARVEGSGLRQMRERARACGGEVDVSTGEAGGVEVLVRLPWSGRTV